MSGSVEVQMMHDFKQHITYNVHEGVKAMLKLNGPHLKRDCLKAIYAEGMGNWTLSATFPLMSMTHDRYPQNIDVRFHMIVASKYQNSHI